MSYPRLVLDGDDPQRPVGTPAPVGELPMTGENHLIFVFGLLFLVTGAGIAYGIKASRSQA